MSKTGAPKRMEEIARLAGVSKPTVSRALNNSPLVTEETKQRILTIARDHGYVVNRSAQNLRRRQTDTIAVVLDFPNLPGRRISDPFHFELLGNITNALAVRQQDVLLCSSASIDAAGFEHIMRNKGVDGIVFIGQGGRHEELRALNRAAVPFVVWGAHLADAGYCVVGSDNHRGGSLVGQRFREIGRQRAMFIGPRGHHPEIEQRRIGFGEGWGAAIEVLDAPDLSFAASRDALLARLGTGEPPPDALFAGSDTMAMGAIAALTQHGIAVPEACNVCGYDDSPSAILHSPPLTTVRQDTQMAGAILVERLTQAIEGLKPASVLLPTDLVVRGT